MHFLCWIKENLQKQADLIVTSALNVDGTIVICVYVDKNKQGRQCMYNVILRRVHAAIVVVEKQWVLHNLSVCL